MAEPLTYEEAQALVARDAILDAALSLVRARIDFSMIKQKWVRDGRSTGEAFDETAELYRMYLALVIRYPDRKICPTGPVDALWHAHILDTEAYQADCEHLFGGYLHHYPYFGMRGDLDAQALQTAFDESVDLFIRHFGVDPTAGDSHARSCRPQKCP